MVSIDIVFGPDHDLTSPKVANQVIGWIQAGLVIFAHFGVCCKSWSRARGIPIGPQPLRSMEHVLGLPVLRHESEKMENYKRQQAHEFYCSRVLSLYPNACSSGCRKPMVLLYLGHRSFPAPGEAQSGQGRSGRFLQVRVTMDEAHSFDARVLSDSFFGEKVPPTIQ